MRAIRWLARDPIHHLMLLGDLYPPLIDVSEVYVATDDGQIVGVGSLFRGFSTPSVITTEGNPAVQNALLTRINRRLETEWLTLSTSASSPILCQFGKRIHFHTEHQTLLRKHIPTSVEPARLIQRSEFDSLNHFTMNITSKRGHRLCLIWGLTMVFGMMVGLSRLPAFIL